MHRSIVRTVPVLAAAVLIGAWAMAQQQRPHGGPAGFPDLVGGLKATEGCIGVEAAQTSSGKQVIFAWFEDKQAVERWYYSDMHMGVMKAFPLGGGGKPMKDVPDDIGPIMCIASVTMNDGGEDSPMPMSQIAIELYTPITGGIYVGGRFAPEGLKVKGMKNIAPPGMNGGG